jgi:hypothetical protein
MKSNFQAGVNTVYNAVVAKGVTPASKTPSAIATAIGNISSSIQKLTVTKLVCTTHTMNYNNTSNAPGTNLPALFNGITGDWGSTSPNPVVYSIGTANQTHIFTVTFNKKVSTIIGIRTYICTGAGVGNFYRFVYNGTTYDNGRRTPWADIIFNANFPTGISVNSATFTFGCQSNTEHSGTSEFEFYGIY